jgi:hypothetical protein
VVTVLDRGVVYRGRRYKSLSEVARVIVRFALSSVVAVEPCIPSVQPQKKSRRSSHRRDNPHQCDSAEIIKKDPALSRVVQIEAGPTRQKLDGRTFKPSGLLANFSPL